LRGVHYGHSVRGAAGWRGMIQGVYIRAATLLAAAIRGGWGEGVHTGGHTGVPYEQTVR
jgi:hypothetical protein